MVHTARLSFNTLLLSLFCFAAFGQNEYPDVWQKSVEQSLRATHFHVFKGKKVYVFNALKEAIEVMDKNEFWEAQRTQAPEWVQKLSDAGKRCHNQQGSYLILNETASRYTRGCLPYQIRNLNGDVLLDFYATNCCVHIGEFHEGLAIFYLFPCDHSNAIPHLKGWFGYIDADGKMIVEPRLAVKEHFDSGMNLRFQDAENWQMYHGLCLRKEHDSAYYFMNKTGAKMLPKDGYYSLATAFNKGGFARVYRNQKELKEHKEVWINTAGKAVTDDFESGSIQTLPNGGLLYTPPNKYEQILLDSQLREVYRFDTKNDTIHTAHITSFSFRNSDENWLPDDLFKHQIVGRRGSFFRSKSSSYSKIVGFSGKEYTPWIKKDRGTIDVNTGVFYGAPYKNDGRAIINFNGDTLFKHDSCRVTISGPGFYRASSTNPNWFWKNGRVLAYVNYRGDVFTDYEGVPIREFKGLRSPPAIDSSQIVPNLRLQFDEATLQKIFDENIKKDPIQIRR